MRRSYAARYPFHVKIGPVRSPRVHTWRKRHDDNRRKPRSMTDRYRTPMGAAAKVAFWRRVLSWRVALGVILLLAVLVRLPFLHVPLITDEGGYAYTTHYGLSGTLYHLLWFD